MGSLSQPQDAYKLKFNAAMKMQIRHPERDFQQKLAGFQLHHMTLAGITTTTLPTYAKER